MVEHAAHIRSVKGSSPLAAISPPPVFSLYILINISTSVVCRRMKESSVIDRLSPLRTVLRRPMRYEWTALSVTTVGALLASVQGSALTIALPEILTGLRAEFLTIMWVLLGYLLITTALVPVIGRLADMFGRKNLYNAGFAIFTLGSLLAGLSQPQFHAWDMVASRVIQGVGGALLFTNSTAIVTDAFEHGRIGFGLGVNQIAAAAGFLLGPVVGGLLTADLLALGVPGERSAGHLRHRVGNPPPGAGQPCLVPDLRLAGKRHVHLRSWRRAPGALPARLPPASVLRRLHHPGLRRCRSDRLLRRGGGATQPMLDLRLFRTGSSHLRPGKCPQRAGPRSGPVRPDLLPPGALRQGSLPGGHHDGALRRGIHARRTVLGISL